MQTTERRSDSDLGGETVGRPCGRQDLWEPELECMERGALEALQVRRLRTTVESALSIPFYRARLEAAGIGSGHDIGSLADLARIPCTTKDDLRSSYPNGFLSVPKDEVIRLHTSSGTTGTPTVIYHTKVDIESWANLMARSMAAAGATRHDVFQNMTGYGLFTGGLGMHYGAEKLGMTVIPTGSGNTARQIRFMQDFRSTVLHATPSYMLHLYDKLLEEGVSPRELSVRMAFLGAEPYSEATRKKVEELWGIDVFNSYGLSEMNGPGVAFECVHKTGMHLWEDAYILEVLDPVTGLPVPDGEYGELVLTTLERQATPILRYRTRDLTRIVPGVCACGRVHRRIDRIRGRSDDMLIVSGVNVFPSQIESVLMKIPEVGNNYLIHLTKKGSLDRLTVKVEVRSELFSGELDQLDRLRKKIQDELHAQIVLHPAVEFHEPGSLPVSEGKAKRVIDERPAL